mmetsp:Transcript_107626/g.335597  ORF Transcript_107626/g.335597 Transcript_107626/m.335597 type:complete len:89 (-) Transcript_107626:32-298(-)
MGEPGENACPPGADPLASKEECEAAAKAQGLKSMIHGDQVAATDPNGCVFRVPDQDVFFNTHAGSAHTERQVICKSRAASKTPGQGGG